MYKCCKGHPLTVPYGFFNRILLIGPDIPKDQMDKFAEYRNWEGIDERNQPKSEGNYMCMECLLDLLMVMEHWKNNDPDLEKLLNKWKMADEERTGS